MGLAFVERLMHGILTYAQQCGGWAFTRLPEMLSPSIDWLGKWNGDGAFVLVTEDRDAELASRLSIPLVNLASHLETLAVPSVTVDHHGIGVMAAEHLLERRFRRFGYYGIQGKWYNQERREGFVQTIHEHGGSCEVLEVVNLQEHPDAWENQQDQLESWLRGLTTPVGIMASSDLRAGMLLEACRRVGLRVPEEVAIIGVDNDPVACEFSQPQLTSISRNDHRVGFEAAAMLHRMILGETPAPVSLRIPPDRVVARKSTEVLAVDDPEVAVLIQCMRERFHEPVGMENLVGNSVLSRRRLEQRFRATMDISPAVFLNQLRVEHAKKLLARKPAFALADIAAQCGFRDPRRFRIVFMRLTGITPAACRRELDSRRSE